MLPSAGLVGRPLYFVSSNLHSLVNLLSGYARRRADLLWQFLEETPTTSRRRRSSRRCEGTANAENILYYAARLWHRRHPAAPVKLARQGRRGGARHLPCLSERGR